MKKQVIICTAFFFAFANVLIAQKMTVKDSDANILMEVNDEGTLGSITLPSGAAPSTTTNKLYNMGGALYWNGSELGTAGTAGGWTDDGTVVRLSTSTDKVGIGDSSPTHTLDVAGKIAVNDTQVVYLPDQTDFVGSFFVGNGGNSLVHVSSEDGQFNTAIGIDALRDITTGRKNTAIGLSALYLNKTGYWNTAIGAWALASNTSGYRNNAIGVYTLASNTSGYENIANGSLTLNNNSTGYKNTAIGYLALYLSTTGNENTVVGNRALRYNTTGSFNTGIGVNANFYNEAGSNNTIIGYEAGSGTAEHDKSGNVFLGYKAGYYETDDNKLYIENSNSSSPLIGGDFDANELYFNGHVGIWNTSPSSELDVAGDIETGSSNAFYFGDPNTDNSWRIVRSGDNLVFERRESGSWVTKDTIYN